MKKVIAFGVIVLIAGGAAWYFMQTEAENSEPSIAQQETSPTSLQQKEPATPGASIGDENLVEFTCAEHKTITAVFTRDIVGLTLSDGRQVELRQVESASGVRYVNGSESIEFRSKGEQGFLVEGGKTTYADCSVS
jgi:membrane-bound inhibitor of C-type lysozyme